jgi:hypothetical protein
MRGDITTEIFTVNNCWKQRQTKAKDAKTIASRQGFLIDFSWHHDSGIGECPGPQNMLFKMENGELSSSDTEVSGEDCIGPMSGTNPSESPDMLLPETDAR